MPEDERPRPAGPDPVAPPPPWGQPLPPPPIGGYSAPPPPGGPQYPAPPPSGPQYPAPPPFGSYASPYGGTYMAGAPQVDGLAVTAFVLALLSFFCLSIFGSIPALILAGRARRYIRSSGGMKTGSGLATAATVLSIINLAFAVLSVIFILALLPAQLHSSASTGFFH